MRSLAKQPIGESLPSTEFYYSTCMQQADRSLFLSLIPTLSLLLSVFLNTKIQTLLRGAMTFVLVPPKGRERAGARGTLSEVFLHADFCTSNPIVPMAG